MKYVGFWRRFAAIFIDILILAVVGGVLGGLLGVSMGGGENGMSVLANVISIVVGIGYWVFYQAKMGQTLGKKVMGIKVVDAQGKTPTMMTFFLREIIGKFVSGIILGIGYLMVIWDPKKQGLHDKIASTYVIKA